MNGLVSLDTSPFCVFAQSTCKLLKDKFGTRGSRPKKVFRDGWGRGENQQTVNLPLLAGYEGSNPSPSTRFSLWGCRKPQGNRLSNVRTRSNSGRKRRSGKVRREGQFLSGTRVRPG